MKGKIAIYKKDILVPCLLLLKIRGRHFLFSFLRLLGLLALCYAISLSLGLSFSLLLERGQSVFLKRSVPFLFRRLGWLGLLVSILFWAEASHMTVVSSDARGNPAAGPSVGQPPPNPWMRRFPPNLRTTIFFNKREKEAIFSDSFIPI